MEEFEIDHIGYLTDDLSATAKEFAFLGFRASEIVNDDRQKTKICFLTKPGETKIELVEPYPDNLSMLRMLKRQGTSPYHTCFVCDDIDNLYDELISRNWTPLFKPTEAPALGNKRICYFFNSSIGYIEFVNKN